MRFGKSLPASLSAHDSWLCHDRTNKKIKMKKKKTTKQINPLRNSGLYAVTFMDKHTRRLQSPKIPMIKEWRIMVIVVRLYKSIMNIIIERRLRLLLDERFGYGCACINRPSPYAIVLLCGAKKVYEIVWSSSILVACHRHQVFIIERGFCARSLNE